MSHWLQTHHPQGGDVVALLLDTVHLHVCKSEGSGKSALSSDPANKQFTITRIGHFNLLELANTEKPIWQNLCNQCEMKLIQLPTLISQTPPTKLKQLAVYLLFHFLPLSTTIRLQNNWQTSSSYIFHLIRSEFNILYFCSRKSNKSLRLECENVEARFLHKHRKSCCNTLLTILTD